MLTRDAIAKAIKCEDWQRFRLSLKGQSTEKKVAHLFGYLSTDVECCDKDTRHVQVYNYLNALSRGGQIAPCVEGDLENNKIVIRR